MGDLQPMNRARASVSGELLGGDIQGGQVLAK